MSSPSPVDDFGTAALKAVGEYLVDLLKANLEAQGLADSRIIKGITYTADVQRGMVVINAPDYARYVEQGRRPYGNIAPFPVNTPPPYGPILEWVKRKRVQLRDKKGRFLSFGKTAWVVRAIIAKKGIKPRPFIEPAIKVAEVELNEYLATSFELVVDKSLRQLIS